MKLLPILITVIAVLISPSVVQATTDEATLAAKQHEQKVLQRRHEIDSKYEEVMVRLRDKTAEHEDWITRLERYKMYHFPVIEGKKVLPIKYLTLPFRKVDVGGLYDITEGWIYSDEEQAIHGFVSHNGIDFAIPYGTPVVAPADGYAMSSYHTFWLRDENGEILTYLGKPLRFGLGNFVQMYIPSANRYIQMAHLSDVDLAIPFSLPFENEGDWVPTNHTLSVPALKESPQYVQVRKGQVLGKVGYSGLSWGYEDYQAGATRPVQIDPSVNQSWDEPHIHFEDFWRHQTEAYKMANRDPYGIYSTAEDYPTPARRGVRMLTPLFYRGTDGLPRFAE
ncbi:MAG: M23 family metallopeptidase [Patescibacteria group bacterium]